MKSTLRYSMEKLNAEKTWFWETGISSWWNEKNRGEIEFAFSTLAEWWKWKMLHWLTMWHCVWMRPGTMWRCGGVLCTKNYSPPSSNDEYYTTASQCKTLQNIVLARIFHGKSCTLEISLPAFNGVQKKHWCRMLPQLQQLISVITISLHALVPISHPPLGFGTGRVSWLVTRLQQLLVA